LWFVKEIKTKPSFHFANGQLSEIKSNKFVNYESVWSADFMRDKNDDAEQFLNIVDVPTRQATAIIKGRNLRDTAFAITLQLLDPSVKSRLRKAITKFSLSMQTTT
jgi:hypothetical protein